VTIFGGEEGEEVSQLHGAEGGRHDKDQHGWADGPNAWLGRIAD
jgi:hypothetical protein